MTVAGEQTCATAVTALAKPTLEAGATVGISSVSLSLRLLLCVYIRAPLVSPPSPLVKLTLN